MLIFLEFFCHLIGPLNKKDCRVSDEFLMFCSFWRGWGQMGAGGYYCFLKIFRSKLGTLGVRYLFYR